MQHHFRERRRFPLTVESLEGRALAAVNIVQIGTEVFVTGDGQPNKVTIIDNGGNGADNITVMIDKKSLIADGPVTRINVRTGGGRDRVVYSTTGNIQAGVERVVAVELGGAADRFQGTLGGNLAGFDGMNAPGKLRFDVNGAGGKDFLAVDATANVHVAPGCQLRVNLLGGGTDDNIRFDYTGRLDGQMFFRLDGAGGKDRVAANLNLDAMSNNRPGDGGGADNLAQVLGGNGKDTLIFMLNPNNGLELFCLLDGGAAVDACTVTPNITTANCP